MKKKFSTKVRIVLWGLLIFIGAGSVVQSQGAQGEELAFKTDVKGRAFGKVSCLMLCTGKQETDRLLNVGKTVKFDLEFTDQLTADLKKAEVDPTPEVLSKLFERGTSLYLSLKEGKKTATGFEIDVVLKEPSSGQVLFNRSFPCDEKNIIYSSHAISNELFPVLTGQSAPVLSTLAYCKQVSPKSKVLCISDYACCKERMLLGGNTISLAPRWHSKAPLLFYSQLTRSNNRLMSFDLRSGRIGIVCNHEGLNMQPSFSSDGIRVVLCLSAGKRGNSELFLYDQHESNRAGKRLFTQITNNAGNNASPNLLSNDDVVFCSDFETGSPQIYYLDRKNNVTKRLSNGRGYCAAPSYNAKTNLVVYSRFVQGCFQLFTIDLNDKKHIEHALTTNAGDKLEPVWSDCGRYVAFSYNCKTRDAKKAVSQIAMLNMASKKIRVLTSGNEAKTFPCWVNTPYYV